MSDSAAPKVYAFPSSLGVPRRSSDLFYAYVKSSNDYVLFHYLLVFATRAASDEWWRALSAPTAPNVTINIKRITPQFYIYDPLTITGGVFLDIFMQLHFPQFINRVFVTYQFNGNLPQSISPLPRQEGADHVSGNWFYIGSQTGEYWYCPPNRSGNLVANTAVYASTTQRTRFQISIIGPNTNGYKGTIMIGTDKISISPGFNLFVGPDKGGVLTLLQGGEWGTPLFSDFGDKFGLLPPPGTGSRDEPEVYVTADNSGLEWELV